MDGAEAVLAAAKGARTAIRIAVQTPGGYTDGAVDYARRRKRWSRCRPARTTGRATDLPLFVQNTGSMSVDLLVRLFRQIPTMRVVKDEAGNPLERVCEIRERTGGEVNIFSVNGARTPFEDRDFEVAPSLLERLRLAAGLLPISGPGGAQRTSALAPDLLCPGAPRLSQSGDTSQQEAPRLSQLHGPGLLLFSF